MAGRMGHHSPAKYAVIKISVWFVTSASTPFEKGHPKEQSAHPATHSDCIYRLTYFENDLGGICWEDRPLSGNRDSTRRALRH